MILLLLSLPFWPLAAALCAAFWALMVVLVVVGLLVERAKEWLWR